MTQTGADRLLVGFGSLLGFAIGGFIGGNVGSLLDERAHPGREVDDATAVLAAGGAFVGCAIGAMIAVPPAAPRQVGMSAPPLRFP